MAIVTSNDFQIEPFRPVPLPTPREVGAVLIRQRWVLVATVVLVVVTMWLTGQWQPTYVAQMKILVTHQRVDAVISPEATSPVIWGGDQVSEEDLNSEVELLKSTDLLRQVVSATGLGHDRSLAAQSTPERAVEAAVLHLEKHLKIEAIRKTNIISVKYESANAQLASKVLVALSQAYAEKHMEVHRPSGEVKFFGEQVALYKQNLAEAQQRLLKFDLENGVVSPQMERDLALQRVNDFSASARQARQTVEEGNERLEVLRHELAHMQPQTVAAVRTSNNEVLLGQLKQALSTLQLKRTEMLGRYAPTYRPIQDLDAQIAELQDSIAGEMNSPMHDETKQANPVYQWAQQELAKTEAEVGMMKTRAAAATSISAQYQGKAQGLNQQSVIQEDLIRDEKTQEENYLLYLHKLEQAKSSEALDRRGIVNVVIAQHPVVPTFPVRTRQYVALMALLICITCGVSSAFVADLMVPSFRTADEVVRYLNAPVLARLPKGGAYQLES
jgi:succinoglycan biosynthesis transport protein ExoP